MNFSSIIRTLKTLQPNQPKKSASRKMKFLVFALLFAVAVAAYEVREDVVEEKFEKVEITRKRDYIHNNAVYLLFKKAAFFVYVDINLRNFLFEQLFFRS